MAKTITQKTKMKARTRPIATQLARMKEGRKLVVFIVRSYFTHSSSNVTWMQIMRSKNNRRSRTNISYQNKKNFMTKVKSHKKTTLTHCLKNWMQRTKINDLLIIYREINEHILCWNDPYHIWMSCVNNVQWKVKKIKVGYVLTKVAHFLSFFKESLILFLKFSLKKFLIFF